MKIATIDIAGSAHPAVLTSSGELLDFVQLRASNPAAHLVPGTTRGILQAGETGLKLLRDLLAQTEQLAENDKALLRRTGALLSADAVKFLPPIPEPMLVLSAAANYGKHVKEFTAVSLPKHPTAFIKTSDSLSSHGAPVVVPSQCPDRVDFEGELCFVFGRTCHNVTEECAMDYVAGYMIANDVSARDWVPEVFAAEERFETIRAWERNVMGKNLPGFTPCGPYLTTADEIADPHKLRIRTTLNGELMQDGSTEELLYNIPQLIAYFSKWYRFHPGDVFTTGSPAGVGVQRKPQVFMKPGDTVDIEITGLGKLSNQLVAAS